jgi:hypothetical protein
VNVAPENSRAIVLDDGTRVETASPVVALFASEGVSYARTRPPGATADVIRPVMSASRGWEAILAHDTQVGVDGNVLTTAGFTRGFPGPVLAVVELSDGAFVVAWRTDDATRERNLCAIERDGRERWFSAETNVWSVRRYDDPFFPDLLWVSTLDAESFVHPYDGHTIFGWNAK